MHIALIFPHQLFQDFKAISSAQKVVLIEDSLFFFDSKYPVKFHKQKLVLHRASLKFYQSYLQENQIQTEYIDYADQNLKTYFAANPQIKKVTIYNPVDFILTKRLKALSQKHGFELQVFESPNFITTNAELKDFFADKKRFHQTDFYRFQRQRLNILLDQNKKPLGGSLTYDTENRKKIPKNTPLPETPKPNSDPLVQQAIEYVEANFFDHPGQTTEFFYPINFEQSAKFLENFIKTKFINFGIYEDAILNDLDNPILFHSALSAPLNIGLLSPTQILQAVTTQKIIDSIPLNSLEGFIRQILGWREFMRAVYIFKGVTQRNSNFFNHQNALPESFWDATTQIPPIDMVIQKTLKYAYAHHIERLMLMGNFMNLAEIHPDHIYHWFMALFIDAYDWVMVPNVYGMSLFADGGLITTKPYVSSSNYVIKMSDFKKGDWSDLWDALYWNFVEKNQEFLKKNIRFGVIIKQLEKMDPVKKAKLQQLAKNYLTQNR
jgi:deoxyribodipyrimidine photolyase-related protein